jgi:molecular chaperone HscC
MEASQRVNDSAVSVGIDLGTTYSLVAVLEDGVPRVLRDAHGQGLIPSCVSLGEDGVVSVGAPALARSTTHPQSTARWFKRDMGTDRRYQLGSGTYTPEALSALVLAEVKHVAEQALGRPVAEAVVTVPAYFGDLQRRATRDACEIAGLHCERIINEPTAAALAYGLHERSREAKVVVMDLGGGTFDVTVLELIEGVVEIQSSAGDANLGGEDFSEALVRLCAERWRANTGAVLQPNSVGWARTRAACERAKRLLSQDDNANVALTAIQFGDGKLRDVETRLTRQDVEAAWAELIERLTRPLQRALRDASLAPKQVDEVLLVGGATRMPLVARLASQFFGKLPLRSLPADEAVAMGAAVQVALKRGDAAVADMVVTDVAPFTLGIATVSSVAGQHVEGVFSPILERGTVLPASRVDTFGTVQDNQTQLNVEVYQGEHSMCADNQRLGSYTVKGIPKGPAGQALEVRFTYDLNGILDVDTTIVASGKTQSVTIEKAPGRLSAAQVADAKRHMKRLKFHPRDALPNVTALARAEAVYVELAGVERAMLGEAIATFRGAMVSQTPSAIDTARIQLSRVVEALRGHAEP